MGLVLGLASKEARQHRLKLAEVLRLLRALAAEGGNVEEVRVIHVRTLDTLKFCLWDSAGEHGVVRVDKRLAELLELLEWLIWCHEWSCSFEPRIRSLKASGIERGLVVLHLGLLRERRSQ